MTSFDPIEDISKEDHLQFLGKGGKKSSAPPGGAWKSAKAKMHTLLEAIGQLRSFRPNA